MISRVKLRIVWLGNVTTPCKGLVNTRGNQQANLAAGDAEKAVPMASEARRVEWGEVMDELYMGVSQK